MFKLRRYKYVAYTGAPHWYITRGSGAAPVALVSFWRHPLIALRFLFGPERATARFVRSEIIALWRAGAVEKGVLSLAGVGLLVTAGLVVGAVA